MIEVDDEEDICRDWEPAMSQWPSQEDIHKPTRDNARVEGELMRS